MAVATPEGCDPNHVATMKFKKLHARNSRLRGEVERIRRASQESLMTSRRFAIRSVKPE